MPVPIRIKQKETLAGVLALAFVLCWNMNLAAQSHLIFAIDIIRHGDRTPTRELPGVDPKIWAEGLGQLTSVGQRQEYDSGVRQRAFCDAGGLFPSPPLADSMRVFSTDFARTRTSARMFLRGFCGSEEKAGTIPILTRVLMDCRGPVTEANSVPASPLMIPTDRPDYHACLAKYVYVQPDWRSTNAERAALFARWSKALGVSIQNMHDTIPPGDTLFIHQAHHLPYPKNFSEADAQAIIDAGRWTLCYQYAGEFGRLSGRDLLERIAHYLTAAEQGKQGEIKYVLFSGHDSTLLSLLSALGDPLQGIQSPPYAASLRFALYEIAPGQFQIQITYNDGGDHALAGPTGNNWSVAQILSRVKQD